MSTLESLKNNFDQFVSDAKIQFESIQNDIKVIPGTIEQITANSQELLGMARVQFEAASDKILKNSFLKKDYQPEIQKVVTEVQVSVTKMFDSIKNAIEKAK